MQPFMYHLNVMNYIHKSSFSLCAHYLCLDRSFVWERCMYGDPSFDCSHLRGWTHLLINELSIGSLYELSG